LAERVDLKVSSLYSHIGSKEELLRKICFDNAALFTKGMSHVEKMEGSVIEKIKAIIALHVDVAVKNPSSVTVFSNEWKHLSDDESEQFNLNNFLVLRKDYENRFRQIIIHGINNGELKKTNPDIALFTILTSVRWLHYWYKPSRNINSSELINQISSLLLNGVSHH
jgi:TetR/AcrR family transcriptional regulator, cholesterol catabolism regulator